MQHKSAPILTSRLNKLMYNNIYIYSAIRGGGGAAGGIGRVYNVIYETRTYI